MKTNRFYVWRTSLQICLFIFVLAGVAWAQTYQEAPQLAERVAAGDLPPVEERLPASPMEVPVLESIGTYGGDLDVALVGGGGLSHLFRYHSYEPLVRWTPDWEGVIPNVASSWEVNDEATEFTFGLREGMKWSDGEPFTADDIMFWYEDVLMNEELTPSVPTWLTSGDEPVVVTKINDATVTFSFASPQGLFLQTLASAGNDQMLRYPKHYLRQFHPTYNSDNLEQLVQQAGAADWVNLFQQKGGSGDLDTFFRISDIPVISAWKFSVAPGEGTTRAVADRNPFYWKVDAEGNQLPYLDRVVYDLVENVEVALLKALNGEVSMQDQYIATLTNKPVLFDNQEVGNYRFFTTTPTAPNAAVIQLNLNHPDPVKREIFQNKDFRIGLSYAINRPEIIDLVYLGQGIPYQAAPRPESDLYNEQLATQYTEYSTELANEHLDAAGYTERDSENFRLGPDGQRIAFALELDAARAEFVDMAPLLQQFWREVGIDVQVRTMDRSLWEVRVRENGEFDATIHRFGGGTGQVVLLDPRYYFPFNGNSMYAPAWEAWYNNPSGEGASIAPEEPPAAVKEQMALYDQLKGTADTDEQKALMRQILDMAVNQFYVIGITTEPEGYGIVENNLKNVPETMPWSYVYPHPAPTNPEQYYYSQP